MNRIEAYSTLDLSPGASEEEINKQFRKMAAKYHPDINKEPGALETSKKISEAYNFLKSNKYDDSRPTYHNVNQQDFPFPFDIDEILSGFGINSKTSNGFRRVQQQHLETKLVISFNEAVLGCHKKISLEKNVKCISCYGKGFSLSENCLDCNGKGHSIKEEKFENKNLKVKVTCKNCDGSGKKKSNCRECNGNGSKKAQTSLEVKLPGGIVTGTRLRLGGQGHYDRFIGSDFYGDAYVVITVTPDPDMNLAGPDVISSLDISLLDALKGNQLMVKTVKGMVPINVPNLSKDKDKLVIAGAGVEGFGNHVVILNVKYPHDTTKLIEFLSKEG